MKSYRVASIVVLLLAANFPAAAATVNGQWTFRAEIAGALRDRNCRFEQNGSTFGGMCRDDEDAVRVDGKIDGDVVTFSYAFNGFGMTLPVVCKGTMTGSTMTGALTLGPLSGSCGLLLVSAAHVSAAADRQCRRYLGRTFEGATITKAEVTPAWGSVAETCVVRGEMPQDLDFVVRMPTRWNGRTVFIGGGGFDGSIGNRFYSAAAMGAGAAGYATIATNHGHDARVTPDASFALDVEMLSEYAYLAVPRVLAPARAILRAQYGRAAERGKTVYEGCSGGGRQALIQAQRYPELFDGIIARAPANAFVPLFMWYSNVAHASAAPGGALSARKIDVIGSAVRAKCDALDGLQDGIIGRPDLCKFDPVELACKAADTEQCLTPAEVATARAYYAPTNVADGRFRLPGFTPGGEGGSAWLGFQSQGFDGFMRYMVARDAHADPLVVDPEKNVARLEYLSAVLDATDPDLRRFKAHGGKLIVWTGQADWLIPPGNATDYYRRVVDAMGGQHVTDTFLEYYTSPDVQHCGGGAGADGIDFVTPMFEWLEKGTTPSSRTIVATKLVGGPKPLTRPLCQYPRYPAYVGGDPNSAASFRCAMPDAPAK